MNDYTAAYLAVVVGYLTWTALKVWEKGWDQQWSIPAQIRIAVLAALLWPVLVMWIVLAVLASVWKRRGY